MTTSTLTPPSVDTSDLETSFRALSNKNLRRSYWVYRYISYPGLVSLGSKIGPWMVSNVGLARYITQRTIFAQFCGGTTILDCQKTIQRLTSQHVGTILDYSVEGENLESSFVSTSHEVLRTIEAAQGNMDIPFCVFKVSGVMGAGILTKRQAGLSLDEVERTALELGVGRIEAICKAAAQAGVRLFIDAEETWFQAEIDALAVRMMLQHNRKQPIIFNTYQCYLSDAFDRLEGDIAAVHKEGAFFAAKLVRGAYMEKEASFAAVHGKETPINPSKEATDKMFDMAWQLCLDTLSGTAFCLGTHNEDSSLALVNKMAHKSIDPGHPHVWFAQLLGMSDNLTFPLAKAGYNVAKYVPYGPVEKVIPYLIRRAQENTSVNGQTTRELALIKAEMDRRGM